MGTITVPFSIWGYVEIEATKEEWEASDMNPLYKRAEEQFDLEEDINYNTCDLEFHMCDAEFEE